MHFFTPLLKTSAQYMIQINRSYSNQLREQRNVMVTL